MLTTVDGQSKRQSRPLDLVCCFLSAAAACISSCNVRSTKCTLQKKRRQNEIGVMEKKKSFAKRSKMAKLPTFKTFSTTIPFFFWIYVKRGFFFGLIL